MHMQTDLYRLDFIKSNSGDAQKPHQDIVSLAFIDSLEIFILLWCLRGERQKRAANCEKVSKII